ncbi:hypothetical protein MRB53_024803 [Persea americana]|uniref:Uncharacterized protein n=1 Tax=Persea americana TaxID=3435 RepID=A0ACC2LDS6_PERAE|nr:hypothetical protein MRB53_024803 [Persea americana]|eukprot:TRINITY_DN12737_c2_g1_i1.p1 TRINITY_DN12737_c2_g1~~TRINITY_DN12737_c2_g1_i1.p1  ORF type:complete len:155 (+),score=26.65 TRINITY_DN12737_c2_g1_i1:96-560(+)
MPPKTGKGNPLQKRGQIKAKIFEDIFKGHGGVTASENRPSFHLLEAPMLPIPALDLLWKFRSLLKWVFEFLHFYFALFSSFKTLYGCFFFFLSLVELEFQSTDPPKKVKGDSQRKRSQIKAKIFEDIFKSIAYFASKAGIKKQEEMGGVAATEN